MPPEAGVDAVPPRLSADPGPDWPRAVELLRQVVAHTPVVMWAVDREGIFTLSEGRGLETLGLRSGQVVGASAFEMYADHPVILDVLRDGLNGREQNTVIEIGAACFENWVKPIRDAAGAVVGAVGVATDVTARVQAERELKSLNEQLSEHVRSRTELLLRTSITLEEQIHERRRTYLELERSEARWRSLVEDAPDIILQLNRHGEIEFINHPNWRDDLTVEQVLGRSANDFLYPAFIPEFQRSLSEVFEHGRCVTNEVSGPTTAGEPCWYQSHLAPLWQDGKVIAATVVVRDITDQHRAAEALQQKHDELTHVARVSMVGVMTASFAHELIQPLAAIAHYIAGCVIRLEKDGQTAPEVLTTLQDAAKEARRASEVVRRLRQFLQKHEIQREDGDLNLVVRESGQLIESTLQKHEIRCEYRLADDLPPVFMDRIQIMQVLLNLLLNSVEAIADAPPDRRLIVIQTARTDRGEAICTVHDRGPGLPAGLPHDIFDAFVTTKPEGLGLGLSISRSIVQAHGGSIRARNHPDGGAEFRLAFGSPSQGD
ncbi:MAG: PAS domain S-box protein [Planctomycetaceae bacterium]|nr:PAS domain S-box protein [Planctomycetaceae bacterium]